jgi:glutamate dehydrogenase (NADP) (EC 1.4.1.4)
MTLSTGTPGSIASTHTLPSYLDANHLGPWGNYLQQVDRVTPYLGSLARWVETLKRPKRILIVDVPIDGQRHHRPLRGLPRAAQPAAAAPARAACAFTRT